MFVDDIDRADWILGHWEGAAHLEQDVMYSVVVEVHLLNWVEIECRPMRKVRGVKFIVSCPVLYTMEVTASFVID